MSTTEPVTTLGDDSLVPLDEQTADIGDNSYDSEKVAFDKALNTMVRLNAERATLNAKIGKARKQMKADGIVLGKLDATIRMLAWSPEEIRDDIDTTLRYAAYAGFSIGHLAEGAQVDMFGHATDDEIADADWRARGRADALRLKPASPPDSCPPERRNAYLEGHGDAKWWSDDDESEADA